jgi:hypothetical protein
MEEAVSREERNSQIRCQMESLWVKRDTRPPTANQFAGIYRNNRALIASLNAAAENPTGFQPKYSTLACINQTA